MTNIMELQCWLCVAGQCEWVDPIVWVNRNLMTDVVSMN